LSIIKEGYKIPLERKPPISTNHPDPHPLSEEATKIVDQEVCALLTKGAIECASGPGFTSPLFVIPKKIGDLRPVLNLRALNQFLPVKHFKMETIQHVCTLIKKNDYLTSIDLSDAFLHIKIHPESRKYLQFLWKGQLYQFKVLPFGLSLAPMIFTKMLKPLLRWARKRGIRISAYLDDLIIAAASKEKSKLATKMVLRKLKELGYLTKEYKSSLIPSQTLEHLGFEINTASMTLRVPGKKIRDVRREASKMVNKGLCTVHQLSSFIGKAIAMTAAVFPARLKIQHLMADKIKALKSDSSWESLVSLSQDATEELLWWRSHLKEWNGLSWITAVTELDIYTDSSDSGWGVVMGNKTCKGLWSTDLINKHINYKELMTVLFALKRPEALGRTVNIISDNITTIAFINRFGGTRSPELMKLAKRIWEWCLKTGTRIKTTYVPSSFNPADAPSRRLIGQLEWSISKRFFGKINRLWGPHHVDLFASATNHQLPQFMTWNPTPGAIGYNALNHDWRKLGNIYLCPPWNLLPIVLQKIRQEKIEATIVTPKWPTAVWYPTVKMMSISEPIPVPRRSVLPAPGNAQDILDKNPHWSLYAWRVNANV
jgi:hypothetical protein